LVSTLLGVGADIGVSQSSNDLEQALRFGFASSVNQAGQQVVGRSLQVQPTLTIRPGSPVRVMVTRDLVLEPFPA
jgi:type IV secretion system protein VirB10